MDEKIFSMKEAAKLLGCSVRTLQRRHQAGGLRCVFTPGGRRRVPENEILRLREEMGLEPASQIKTEATKRTLRTKTKKRIVLREEPPIMPVSKEEPKKPESIPAVTLPPQALSDFEIIERMAPESLPMRKAFNDLLATAAMLETFTSNQLLERSSYPEQAIKSFCDRLAAKNLASLESGRYTLKVRLVR
jgi:excisionase family DNA binding protein